jgi:hypothetical protein
MNIQRNYARMLYMVHMSVYVYIYVVNTLNYSYISMCVTIIIHYRIRTPPS